MKAKCKTCGGSKKVEVCDKCAAGYWRWFSNSGLSYCFPKPGSGEFTTSYRNVINMCDPQANSLMSKDNPPTVKILADWSRVACDLLDRQQAELDRLNTIIDNRAEDMEVKVKYDKLKAEFEKKSR